MTGKRVVFMSSEYPPYVYGGLGTTVYELSRALARRGVKLGLVVPAREGYVAPPPGVDLLEVPVDGASSDDEFWLRFCYEASSATGRSWAHADVIHAHDWMTVLGGIRLRDSLQVPLAFSVHLPQLAEPNLTMESLGLLYADCVLVNSRAVAAELAQRQLPIRTFRFIPNGVDLERFHAARPVPRSGTILFVGRLVAQKGVDVALRALAAVLGRCPSARLVVAGDGDEALYLQRLARYLGVASHVTFAGWQTGDALAELYQRADVVVVPSHYEPFGLVALEAMASGRPVIASRTGGLAEVVVDQQTGYLVPPGDHLRFAQRLAALLLDNDTATRLGRAARQRAESYGWDSVAARTEQVYDQLAGAEIASPLGDPGALVEDLLRSVQPEGRVHAERLMTMDKT